MITVSVHACERFVERVLKLKDAKPLTQTQITLVETEIVSELAIYQKTLGTVLNGEYNIGGEYKIVVKEGYVTTIKSFDDQPRYKGGVMRSGKKIKKSKRSEYHANNTQF